MTVFLVAFVLLMCTQGTRCEGFDNDCWDTIKAMKACCNESYKCYGDSENTCGYDINEARKCLDKACAMGGIDCSKIDMFCNP